MRKFCFVIVFLLCMTNLFSEEKKYKVECYVGINLATTIQFNRNDKTSRNTSTIIEAVLPYEKGYIIKFKSENGINTNFELYAEKGTEFYLDNQYVMKITEIYPNGFTAEFWEDKSLKND